MGRNDEAQVMLARINKDKWLVPEVIQEWCVKLGDNLFNGGDKYGAIKVYRDGLAKDMPKEGEVVQSLQVRLGTILDLVGKVDEARALFEAAGAGSGEMWRRVAEERLNQMEIDKSISTVDTVVNQ